VSRLSLERIEDAAAIIDPVFRGTPQLEFEPLSRALGAELVLKVETLNPIRSFKGRGADFLLDGLSDRTPLVAASAGNFGQGLAYAARKRGVTVTVFAATGANPLKVARMRELGADVVLAGDDFDAAKAAAREHAARRGLRFVEDGRDVAIAEGAGSIAVELLRSPKPFDAVLVPLGNGALVAGIGTWVKDKAPSTRVIGVVAGGAPAMALSWRRGEVVSTASSATIADGIAVRVPVPEALADMRGVVDEVVEVEDAAMLAAMRLLLAHAGLMAEPAGVAGIAALLADRERYAGRRVATPICGSNLTPEQIAAWLGAAD
jgi:threonine dehydratase